MSDKPKRPMKQSRSIMPAVRLASIKLDADFYAAKDNCDVDIALDEYKAVMEKAALAFFEDTKDVNSLDTIRSIVVKPFRKYDWMSADAFEALAGIQEPPTG